MKDDKETKAGWGWINLNFLFKPWAWLTVVWHDEITKRDSFATRSCITGLRVAEAFRDQIRRAAEAPRNGLRKLIAKISGDAMETLQPPFYDGIETEAEREECLRKAGRNPDGTLKDEKER